MTEISLVEVKKTFCWRVVQVNSVGIIKIEFHYAKGVVATRRLPDDLAKISGAQCFPVDGIWVHDLPLLIDHLVIASLQKSYIPFNRRQ